MEYQKTKAACNYFIERAKQEGMHLTPMQAIKLVYFAHGYSLGILDRPLIDDHVEAWKFGAVIPSLYHALKMYGANPIEAPILDNKGIDYWDWITMSPKLLVERYPDAIIRYDFNSDELDILDSVWQVYKGKSGFELSSYIHKPNTPWTKVWEKNGKYTHGAIIDDSLIKSYYKQKVTGNEN